MIYAHVPQCYRKMCEEMGVLPLCPCNTCEGKQTHPGDRFGMPGGQGFAHKRLVPTQFTEPPLSPRAHLKLETEDDGQGGNLQHQAIVEADMQTLVSANHNFWANLEIPELDLESSDSDDEHLTARVELNEPLFQVRCLLMKNINL